MIVRENLKICNCVKHDMLNMKEQEKFLLNFLINMQSFVIKKYQNIDGFEFSKRQLSVI